MSDTPDSPCTRAFPIKQSAEHRSARRQFFTFVGGALLALTGTAFGTKTPWFRRLFERSGEHKVAIADVDELAVGASKLFYYPTDHDPCLLIHHQEGHYAAYSQKCTHLMCPVHYNHSKGQIVCPCHAGFFSPKDGSVIAGPPPRPLPKYPVEVHQGKVWVLPG